MTFIKNKEDFVCENCEEEILGNGYTNHCPKCLYSKHVDVNPGDRVHNCNGLMEPIEVDRNGQEHVLTHRCLKCLEKKRCKTSTKDNFDTIIQISNRLQN
jgi:hypothetical protein